MSVKESDKIFFPRPLFWKKKMGGGLGTPLGEKTVAISNIITLLTVALHLPFSV